MNEPPPDLSTEREKSRLIKAALLESPTGVAEDHLREILAAYSSHLVMTQVWKSVMAGDLGIRWSKEQEEAVFRSLSPEERVARRKAISEGVIK